MSDEMPPAFVRLFIALPVPAAVRDEISRAQGRLRRAVPPGAVRWTRTEQLHVTLKFLGDFPTARVEDLKAAVASVCESAPAMKLSAEAVGFFPSASKPRVVWVGVRDAADTLMRLQRRIHEAVLPFAPADRSERFVAHITLGRFKLGKHGSLEGLMVQAAKLRSFPLGEWQAEVVEIVRSELMSTGAMHKAIAAFKLSSEEASLAEH